MHVCDGLDALNSKTEKETMKKTHFLIIAATCQVLLSSAETLLLEKFEKADGINSGSIAGQNGWFLSKGEANAQASLAQEGVQSLEMTEATVMHDISVSNRNVWLRFQARISGAPQTIPSVSEPNSCIAFYVGTNLNIVAYSNNIPVDLGIAMPVDVWMRFDVYCNLDEKVWNLSMDGTTIGAALSFYSDSAEIKTFRLSSTATSPAYFDHIDMSDHEQAAGAPDSDGDGAPDWWELEHFDGITACIAANPSPNTGMTYLETYIANVDPHSYDPVLAGQLAPNHLYWVAHQSRLHVVEWTPTLASNFVVIASLPYPINEYLDAGHQGEATGFYRLQIGIE